MPGSTAAQTLRPTWAQATVDELDALYRALIVSPTLEVCRAMLRGETVPISRLDPVGLARLGRRP